MSVPTYVFVVVLFFCKNLYFTFEFKMLHVCFNVVHIRFQNRILNLKHSALKYKFINYLLFHICIRLCWLRNVVNNLFQIFLTHRYHFVSCAHSMYIPIILYWLSFHILIIYERSINVSISYTYCRLQFMQFFLYRIRHLFIYFYYLKICWCIKTEKKIDELWIDRKLNDSTWIKMLA